MATYTDTLLANGERVLRREHQHWFVLVYNARFAVLALITAVLLLLLGANLGQDGFVGVLRQVLGFLTLAAVVFGVLSLIWSYLRFTNEEYVITSRRIIHTEGVINKKATDSSLEKINDAILSESVFGRIFGFGDLDVLTASETGIERLRMLRAAKDYKKVMIEAKHELELELTRPVAPPVGSGAIAGGQAASPATALAHAGAGAGGATHGAGSFEDRAAITPDEVTYALDRLADLRDKGVITLAEFEAKKAELLGRL